MAEGRVLEIAGYALHPEMAAAIDAIKLGALSPAVRQVDWLEVSAQTDPQVTPASRRVIETWRGKGIEVRDAGVTGESFWSTLEITECAALLDATDASLAG